MKNREYLQTHLQECFHVIDSCLADYYAGETHMYRPLAGQLRLLWRDFNRGKEISLLLKLHPEIRIRKLQPLAWSSRNALLVWCVQLENETSRVTAMPYEIIRYRNDLVIADFLYTEPEETIDIKNWITQLVCYVPAPLTGVDIVKHIADKGGGSHVDDKISAELRRMYEKVPTGTGHTYAELFIVALARLTQQIGEKILGYTGCKVPFDLQNDRHEIFRPLMLAHKDLANALSRKYDSGL